VVEVTDSDHVTHRSPSDPSFPRANAASTSKGLDGGAREAYFIRVSVIWHPNYALHAFPVHIFFFILFFSCFFLTAPCWVELNRG